MARRGLVLATTVLTVLGAAQLVSLADDDFPIEIAVILAKAQAGIAPTKDELHELSDYATRRKDYPIEGVTFGDVLAICTTASQTHEKPPATEIARMRKWASGMKAKKEKLLKDAKAVEGELEKGHHGSSGGPPVPNGSAHFMIDSVVTDEIEDTADWTTPPIKNPQPGDDNRPHQIHQHKEFKSRLTTGFEADFAITIDIPKGEDLRIVWDDRQAIVASVSVTGSCHVAQEVKERDETKDNGDLGFQTIEKKLDDTLVINVGAGLLQGSTTSGEIDLPKNGARPYFKAVVGCPGASRVMNEHTHRHVQPAKMPEQKERKPDPITGKLPPPPKYDFDDDRDVTVAGIPGAAVSVDEFALDGPYSPTAKVPPEYRDTVAAKLPQERIDAARNAQCTFDANGFMTAYRAGKPFKQTLTYSYTVVKKTEKKTTVASTSKIQTTRETLTTEVSVRVEIGLGSTEATLEIVPGQAPVASGEKPDPNNDAKYYHEWMPRPFFADDDPTGPPENLAKVMKAFDVKEKRDRATTISFCVRFAPKPGADMPKGQIRVEFKDMSENVGLCGNYPPRDAQKAKGLYFPIGDASDKKKIQEDDAILEVAPDGQSAWTKQDTPVSSVTFRVAAREAGAWGTLVASCPDRHLIGRWRLAGTLTVPIPDDDHGNHVATKYGVGKEATWDEDAYPAGQRRNGDGYTFYEEYRGFIVLDDPSDKDSWKHVRTDWNKKDVFVYDRDGLIHKYYEPHNDEAAKLVLHYLNPDLLWFDPRGDDPEFQKNPPEEHRQVNINSPKAYKIGPQYAAFCFADNEAKDYEGGASSYLNPAKTTQGMGSFQKPLKYQSEIRICLAFSRSKIPSFEAKYGFQLTKDQEDACVENYIHGLLVHEFGHQIGIHHHLCGAQPSLDKNGNRKKVWTSFDEQGNPQPNSSDWPETDPAIAPNIGWGVMSCPMRYQQLGNDLAKLKKGNWPMNVKYCRNGDKGRNQKDDEYVVTDGCWEQIDVKTDP